MSIKTVNHLDENQIRDLKDLYQKEMPDEKREIDEIRRMLGHCNVVVGLFDTDKERLVGFARVLTDFVYKALIFDVIVDPDYRGMGLRDDIMDSMLTHRRLQNVRNFELCCSPGEVEFYEKWKFSPDVGECVLMKYSTCENHGNS